MKSSERAGEPVSRAEVDGAAGSPAVLEELLVRLATAAASDDFDAMDTLLYAIDSQRLAEPGIRRVVFNHDDVGEVAQDVLIAVAEAVGTFRGEGRFTSWLFGVGRNKALQFVRRKRAESPLRTDLGETERISSLIINTMSLNDFMVRLPEPYRAAVTMRDLDGQTYADIAQRLDLNLNTVRSHIARGRAMLAAMANDGSPANG